MSADPLPTDLKERALRLEQATRSLVETVSRLCPGAAAADSLLPGWSRGHLLTHLARNADGMRNLLTWARTGRPTPMYLSVRRRTEDIEAGAPRSSAELLADVRESAERLAGDIDSMPAEAWAHEVRLINGTAFPAVQILWHRLKEVEIHHLDLATGRSPADWPAAFAHQVMAEVTSSFALRADGWAVRLVDSDTGTSHVVGRPAADSPTVQGAVQHLLAWLIGRGAVAHVRADSGHLPVPPPWT